VRLRSHRIRAAVLKVHNVFYSSGSCSTVSGVQDADLVLSTRDKMRSGTGRSLRQDAKSLGVPVLSLKGSTLSQCVGALRVVLGVDPSPGRAIRTVDPARPSLADPNYGSAHMAGLPER
jgi:hypothetical protein